MLKSPHRYWDYFGGKVIPRVYQFRHPGKLANQ